MRDQQNGRGDEAPRQHQGATEPTPEFSVHKQVPPGVTVQVGPGATTLARTPLRARCEAIDLMKVISAAFDAA